MSLRYGSICSGVAPQTKAWKALGLECAWFSEIEPFPSAVLKHHFPELPNLGDFTKIGPEHGPLDLLIGGTPCQAFSVAGLRNSLSDERGNLTLEFVRLADRLHVRGILWENVPGVLSTNDNAFGCFLGALVGADSALVPARGQRWTNAGLVSGPKRTAAWIIKDAQFHGVAQRRRRVFVLAFRGSGNWATARALFPQFESLRGHIAPSREKGQGTTYSTAPSLTASGRGVERTGESRGQDPVVAIGLDSELNPVIDGSGPLKAISPSGGGVPAMVAHSYSIQSVNMVRERKQNGIGISDEEVMYTVTGRDQHAVAFHSRQDPIDLEECSLPLEGKGGQSVAIPINTQPGLRGADTSNSSREGVGIGNEGDPMFTLQENHGHAVAHTLTRRMDGSPDGAGQGAPIVAVEARPTMAVRRLTPRECERLQGMSDDYTLIPWRGKMAPDGPRYKAIGNSWAVPVLTWIAKRIMEVESIGGW